MSTVGSRFVDWIGPTIVEFHGRPPEELRERWYDETDKWANAIDRMETERRVLEAAARELLEALPRCVSRGMARSARCDGVATHGEGDWGPFCDGCDPTGKVDDLPYAAAVRKLREVLG